MRVVEARCALCWPHSRGKGCGQGPAAAGGRAPQESWSGVMPACSDRRAPKKRKTERNTNKIGTEACGFAFTGQSRRHCRQTGCSACTGTPRHRVLAARARPGSGPRACCRRRDRRPSRTASAT
eukprot:scaffold3542_cov113-Isochrysis_galbana.AAC.16